MKKSGSLLICIFIACTAGASINVHRRGTVNDNVNRFPPKVRSVMRPNARMAPDLIPLIDSTIDYLHNSISHTWNTLSNRKTSQYIYDGHQNLTSYLVQIRNGSVFRDSEMVVMTYDANNNMTSAITETWSGSDFVYTDENLFYYDLANNLQSNVHSSRSGSDFISIDSTAYDYDASGNELNETDFARNGPGLVATTRYIYSYNAHNDPVTETGQDTSGGSFETLYQDTAIYTYDGNFNATTILWENWNGSSYDYDYLITQGFTNDALTTYSEEEYDGFFFVPDVDERYYYDGNNFNNAITIKLYTNDGTLLYYGDSTFKYLEVITGINGVKTRNDLISVYPNPSHGYFTITSAETMSNATLIIFDAPGKEVYAAPFTGNVTTISEKLSPGIYTVRITSDAQQMPYIQHLVIE